MSDHQWIAVIDFGSQYSQLIARRIREQHVYCELIAYTTTAAELRERRPAGIILSGGPASVFADGAPHCDPELLQLGIPVLGICYGLQLTVQLLGGEVRTGSAHEYGAAKIDVIDDSSLFAGLPAENEVWMSHGDQVEQLPDGFAPLAKTGTCPVAAMANPERRIYGLQFHPEVVHTPNGAAILKNFVFSICQCVGDWAMSTFLEDSIVKYREQIGSDHVVCGLSGGVDSSVVAMLLHRAIGKQLHCVFVDNGLCRSGEVEEVERIFGNDFGLDLHVAHAADRFVSALAGVIDPEEKRKIIGHVFIDVFKEEAAKLGEVKYLAQGTLYPDVIESVSPLGGPSVTIKSHHNVGGLPDELGFELIEPLRELFKDEVRVLGTEAGLPDPLVHRQPFPGPGLAVRIVGDVTPDRLAMLRQADLIVQEEVRQIDMYPEIWQSFAVLLPVQSVGVMGDSRTYEYVAAVRAVQSVDGMTAHWVHLPYDCLERISSRIINEVRGINRLVYDISSKPPSTIEWE